MYWLLVLIPLVWYIGFDHTIGSLLGSLLFTVTVYLLGSIAEYFDKNKYPTRNFKSIGKITFPLPQDIDINMMPFIIGDINSLPLKYRTYWPLIEACPYDETQCGSVGYLSISEGLIEKDSTQRRPGIHTDRSKGLLHRPKGLLRRSKGLILSPQIECQAKSDKQSDKQSDKEPNHMTQYFKYHDIYVEK